MTLTALAAIARSALIVFAMEAVKPRWGTAMSGATTMPESVSWAAMAYGGGYPIDAMGCRGVFLIGAVSTMLGAGLFLWCFCRSHCGQTNRSA